MLTSPNARNTCDYVYHTWIPKDRNSKREMHIVAVWPSYLRWDRSSCEADRLTIVCQQSGDWNNHFLKKPGLRLDRLLLCKPCKHFRSWTHLGGRQRSPLTVEEREQRSVGGKPHEEDEAVGGQRGSVPAHLTARLCNGFQIILLWRMVDVKNVRKKHAGRLWNRAARLPGSFQIRESVYHHFIRDPSETVKDCRYFPFPLSSEIHPPCWGRKRFRLWTSAW